jgi:glycosyltransferase involved in cell wall biosynthesis
VQLEKRQKSVAPLVSVVIPCFNAERWITEAIDSCLRQTYSNVEVIVVDDGSTDGGPRIVESYGDRVRLIRQSNAGGCVARNVGFAESNGVYIQFLDADDYIYPEKLARQISRMRDTECDVVFGDWQHQHHEPDGRVWKQEPAVSGEQKDVLESLLAGWWVSPAALLFRRKIVAEVDGWDESLAAAQDRDFFTRVAMATEKIAYEPTCDAAYRRYGNVTVGTSNPVRFMNSHLDVIRKAEKSLSMRGEICRSHRLALAQSYFYLARNLAAWDFDQANTLARHVTELDPSFVPSQNYLYDLLFRLLGFRTAEIAALWKRRLTR